VITRLEKRIAMVTHLPEENGEGLQILHYENGQARPWPAPARPCGAWPEAGQTPARCGGQQGAPFCLSFPARRIADTAGVHPQKYEPHHDFFHDQVCGPCARHPRARVCTRSTPLQALNLRPPLRAT